MIANGADCLFPDLGKFWGLLAQTALESQLLSRFWQESSNQTLADSS
jgi:hypothetical protein